MDMTLNNERHLVKCGIPEIVRSEASSVEDTLNFFPA